MDYIHMLEMLFSCVVGWALSAIALPYISLVSYRCRLFDRIEERKLHTMCIPRLGGIAFYPSITIAVSLTIMLHNTFTESNMLDIRLTTLFLSVFCGLFLIYLMGIMDDLIGVRYSSKFVVQIFCAMLVVSAGLHFDNLYGLFGIYEIHSYIGVPFTMLVIVLILNAINLIDGIDGLASGLSIIAFFAFGCMFIQLGWWLYALVSFASFGVQLPFFYYNVFGDVNRGRKIFMGDTGSLTIGLLLAVLAICLSMTDVEKEETFPASIVIAFSFLIVPILDVVRVVIYRIRNGRNPFLPDKNHIHHRFMALGMTQHHAMVCIVGIALVFVVMNVLLVHYLSTTTLFLLDVVIWTIMHVYIGSEIRRKTK